MSSRHRRHRADVAAFRRCGDDLLVDLFEAGTSLHGRLGRKPRAIAATGLSDGRAIPADVAILIIANVSVEPANDGLFPDLLAQTWRMK